MRSPLPSLVALTVAAGLCVVSPAEAEGKRAVVDRIVAVVDDECITQREVDREAAPKVEASGSAEREAQLGRARREALTTLIEERLFEKEASRRSVRVTAAEIDATLDRVAAQLKVSRAELLKKVADQGWSEAAYRARIGRQLLEAKVLLIELATRDGNQKSSETERATRLVELRKTVVAELRAAAHIEEKL